ncbi:MAG: hypothetical protein ACHRHE_07795 [Tepidisphaerales bacterium]
MMPHPNRIHAFLALVLILAFSARAATPPDAQSHRCTFNFAVEPEGDVRHITLAVIIPADLQRWLVEETFPLGKRQPLIFTACRRLRHPRAIPSKAD